MAGGEIGERGPRFDAPLTANDYAWWYLDVVSDDHRHALVIIAFIGSVFSPDYRRARTRETADPLQFCAFNVALYGAPRRWVFSQVPAFDVRRTASSLTIGRNSWSWGQYGATIRVQDRTARGGQAVVGTIDVEPVIEHGGRIALDRHEQHLWSPIAPAARVKVRFSQPALQFHGTGYVDANLGAEPIEHGFRSWTWARATYSNGASVVFDTLDTNDVNAKRAWTFDMQGKMKAFVPPANQPLRSSGWLLPRQVPSGVPPRVIRTLEDAPFYARSLVAAEWHGEPLTVMHEVLSLERFTTPWVQWMIPFRMRRGAAGAQP